MSESEGGKKNGKTNVKETSKEEAKKAAEKDANEETRRKASQERQEKATKEKADRQAAKEKADRQAAKEEAQNLLVTNVAALSAQISTLTNKVESSRRLHGKRKFAHQGLKVIGPTLEAFSNVGDVYGKEGVDKLAYVLSSVCCDIEDGLATERSFRSSRKDLVSSLPECEREVTLALFALQDAEEPATKKSRFPDKCHYCQKVGHMQSECRSLANARASFQTPAPFHPFQMAPPAPLSFQPGMMQPQLQAYASQAGMLGGVAGGGFPGQAPAIKTCIHCFRIGHTVDTCYQKFPHLDPRRVANKPSSAYSDVPSVSIGETAPFPLAFPPISECFSVLSSRFVPSPVSVELAARADMSETVYPEPVAIALPPTFPISNSNSAKVSEALEPILVKTSSSENSIPDSPKILAQASSSIAIPTITPRLFSHGSAQLCRTHSLATHSLSKVLGKNRRLFNPAGMKCTFCSKAGHLATFCPLKPTEPPLNKRVPFVESLLALDRIDPLSFQSLPLPAARSKLSEDGAHLNLGNPWANSSDPLNSIRSKLGYWKALGASNSVISWLGYGIPLRFASEPQSYFFHNHPSFHAHSDFGEQELQSNVDSGAFNVAPPDFLRVISPMQLEPKGESSFRLCNDMRYINAFLPHCQFKMDTLHRCVPDVVEPGNKLFTVDLLKAYYRLLMCESAWPFLGAQHKGIALFAKVLVFGLGPAPMYFTKICKPIVTFLRILSILLINYIDDWLFSEKSAKVEGLVEFIKWILVILGWAWNEKSHWFPSFIVAFLGFLIDAEKFEVQVPEERRLRVRALLQVMKTRADADLPVTLADLRSVTGHVLSLSLAIPSVRVWSRALYRDIAMTERVKCPTVRLDPESVAELSRLIFVLDTRNGSPIKDPGFICMVQVDSSETGTGASCKGKEVFIPLPTHHIGKSSTFRELSGLNLATRALIDHIPRGPILFQMDSFCSVRNLQKGGGPVAELCGQVKEFEEFCESRGIFPILEWVPRERLHRVDELSKTLDMNWRLKPIFYSRLLQRFGPMSSDWNSPPDSTVFMLPNFNAIGLCLRTAQRLKRRLVLVYPCWPGQSWWPLTVSLSSDIIELPEASISFEPDWQRAPIGTGPPKWRIFAALFCFC